MKWAAIKGLFVETEEDATEDSSKKLKIEKAIEPQKVVTTTPIPQTISVDVSAGKPDQAVLTNLSQVLEEANLEGFDYFEFAKIIENMMASIPSEQVRYQAAFATAAAMNASKQKLLDTADHYITVLSGEADKFSAIVAEQTQSTVTSKEESVKTIDVAISEKANLITQLTQDINELTSNKTNILNEASESKIKIQKIQNDFAACLKIFIDKINGDKAKINQYIPN
jgi:hypothetical protein